VSREALQELAERGDLGIRRLTLAMRDEEAIEVTGAGVGGRVEPAAADEHVPGLDHAARCEDVANSWVRMFKAREFGWIRCPDGVVITVPVGERGVLIAETLGWSAAAGALVTRLRRLAKRLDGG
jgi:hypothetical protein